MMQRPVPASVDQEGSPQRSDPSISAENFLMLLEPLAKRCNLGCNFYTVSESFLNHRTGSWGYIYEHPAFRLVP